MTANDQPPINDTPGRDVTSATSLTESEAWCAISRRYTTVLRLIMLTSTGGLLAVGSFLTAIADEEHYRFFLASTLTLTLGLLLLALFWIPRRVRRIQYSAREEDVHMRSGYLWRKTVSVAVNRIQHIEVVQGPLERFYGLSQLVIYTAGGGRSDLRIPGLPHAEAHKLKAHLTQQIVQEELNEEF